MRDATPSARAVLRACGAAALGLVLAACGNDVAKWSEEVQLADGRVVKLERRAERKAKGLSGERGPIESWELCHAPDKFYWKSAGEFRPSHFEIAGGTAFVKVPLHHCETCKAGGMPPDSTAYFALRGGRWVRIEAAEFPDRRWKNLMEIGIFDSREASRDLSGHLPVAEKWKRDTINESTRTGQAIRADQLQTCGKCAATTATSLKLEPASVPKGDFCR